jgi:hypothetical protein
MVDRTAAALILRDGSRGGREASCCTGLNGAGIAAKESRRARSTSDGRVCSTGVAVFSECTGSASLRFVRLTCLLAVLPRRTGSALQQRRQSIAPAEAAHRATRNDTRARAVGSLLTARIRRVRPLGTVATRAATHLCILAEAIRTHSAGLTSRRGSRLTCRPSFRSCYTVRALRRAGQSVAEPPSSNRTIGLAGRIGAEGSLRTEGALTGRGQSRCKGITTRRTIGNARRTGAVGARRTTHIGQSRRTHWTIVTRRAWLRNAGQTVMRFGTGNRGGLRIGADKHRHISKRTKVNVRTAAATVLSSMAY